MPDILRLDEITPDHRGIVGGKAANLALFAANGFAIPRGFVVTTDAWTAGRMPDDALATTIRARRNELGPGLLAVRSSATVEDGDEASFAGQFESVLDVDDDSLLDAIGRVRASADSERVRAYCNERGIRTSPAIAVLVQRMATGELAGITFTQDPFDSSALLIEFVPSPCSELVSGAARPEQTRFRRSDGTRLGPSGPSALPADMASKIADICSRMEELFGRPLDVEWSLAGGELSILQARPITTDSPSIRDALLQVEIDRLRGLREPPGTTWARDEFSESLPLPTPMTWALLHRLLGPAGGMGRMADDLGLTPNRHMPASGVYDLIAGRAYRNSSRDMYSPDPAIASGGSTAGLRTDRIDFRFILRLPRLLWRLARNARRINAIARTFPERFRNEILPPYLRDCEHEAATDYSRLTATELLHRLDDWAERLLGEFARDGLKPTLFAATALTRLRSVSFGRPSPIPTVPIEPEHDLAGALRRLGAGTMPADEFQRRFGHRGPRELELSEPRWSELPRPALPNPASKSATIQPVEPWLNRVQQTYREFAGLRETARHYFMLGYRHLRRLLEEIDRRYQLQGGVFFLHPDELPRLVAGENLASVVAERRRCRRIFKTIALPGVIANDDLDAIARPNVPADSPVLAGAGLSPGVGEGPALVLREPGTPPDGPFVLVCPSADPAWTPYYGRATGLVVEIGGLLSHGAIVAREFGVPAVGNVIDATRRIPSGRPIRVDGSAGTVHLLND